jgi:hypothetical protein
MSIAKRLFKIGLRTIEAPLPLGTLEENVKSLAQNFPAFRWTTVLDSDAVAQADGSLIYELQLPPSKSNG